MVTYMYIPVDRAAYEEGRDGVPRHAWSHRQLRGRAIRHTYATGTQGTCALVR